MRRLYRPSSAQRSLCREGLHMDGKSSLGFPSHKLGFAAASTVRDRLRHVGRVRRKRHNYDCNRNDKYGRRLTN